MTTSENLIKRLLNQKGNSNNTIDLNAYALGLTKMLEELDTLHINDVLQLLPKAFAPLISNIEKMAELIQTDLECKTISEDAALDAYQEFADKYINFGWSCTDLDNEQYGKKLGEGHYIFREKNTKYELNPDEENKWIEFDILMETYTDSDIDNFISGYYDSIDEIKTLYGDDWEWIVAECIFEQESGLY